MHTHNDSDLFGKHWLLARSDFQNGRCPYEQGRNAQINLRYWLEVIETDSSEMAKRQRATIGRGAGLLHCILNCAARPNLTCIIGVVFRNDPAGAWSKLTEQMGYFLDKSAIQVIQDIARTAAAPGKSTARHDYRDRFGLVWRKRGIRPVAGCVKHDFGRQSQTNTRYLEIFARSFSVVCDGWGSLFSVACVARDRGAAESV